MEYRASVFPYFEVVSYETALPVFVMVWHVRSVRPIREANVDDETLTRIEFSDGDVLDTSDSVREVLDAIREALAPVSEWLASGVSSRS